MFNVIKSFFNGVIDFFTGCFNWFFGGLVDLILGFISNFGLTIEIPVGIYDILNELFIGVGYIIPVKALLPIPFFMISFYILKLIFSLYQLIAGTIIQRVHLSL